MKARQKIHFYDERSEHFLFFSLDEDRDDPGLNKGAISPVFSQPVQSNSCGGFSVNMTDELELLSYDGSFDDTFLNQYQKK